MFGPFFWGAITAAFIDAMLPDRGWTRFLIGGAVYVASSLVTSHFFFVVRL